MGAWWLSSSTKLVLVRYAASLSRAKAVTVTVTGYSNNWGGARENLVVSRQRAKAVANFLRKGTVLFRMGHVVRLIVKALGEKNPRASNSTAAGQAQNRRVVITALET
jgi:OOP family OmpA-OmpF porin